MIFPVSQYNLPVTSNTIWYLKYQMCPFLYRVSLSALSSLRLKDETKAECIRDVQQARKHCFSELNSCHYHSQLIGFDSSGGQTRAEWVILIKTTGRKGGPPNRWRFRKTADVMQTVVLQLCVSIGSLSHCYSCDLLICKSPSLTCL